MVAIGYKDTVLNVEGKPQTNAQNVLIMTSIHPSAIVILKGYALLIIYKVCIQIIYSIIVFIIK